MPSATIRAKYPRRAVRPIEERFWAKVDKGDGSGCWLWTGFISSGGYGRLGVGRRGDGFIQAHRLSLQIALGREITAPCVCHKCDVRACVRPDHLFEGTYADNLADARQKGRLDLRGEKHPKSKLTSAQVQEIKELSRLGFSQTSLGRNFGVSHAMVGKILRGESWTHVEE